MGQNKKPIDVFDKMCDCVSFFGWLIDVQFKVEKHFQNFVDLLFLKMRKIHSNQMMQNVESTFVKGVYCKSENLDVEKMKNFFLRLLSYLPSKEELLKLYNAVCKNSRFACFAATWREVWKATSFFFVGFFFPIRYGMPYSKRRSMIEQWTN